VRVYEACSVVNERHVVAFGHLFDAGAAMARPTECVIVLALDGPFEVHVRNIADQSVVVARLETMRARRQYFLRGHTASEDTEAAAGFTVVDQRQFDIRFLD